MKKVLLAFVVIFGLFIGGGIYVWNKIKGAASEVVNSVKGGEISKPNMANWGKLKKGMTVQEAEDLLGSSIIYTRTENDVKTTYIIYTYSDGILALPSDKSHYLEFDSNEKLVKWREPKEEVNNEVKSVEKN